MDPQNPQQSTPPPTSTPPTMPPSPSFSPPATPLPPAPTIQPPMSTPAGIPTVSATPPQAQSQDFGTPPASQPVPTDMPMELHEHKKTPLWILWVIIAVVIGVSVIIFIYISNKSAEETAALWPAVTTFLV